MSLADCTQTKRVKAKAHRDDYRCHFSVIANAISQMIDRTDDKQTLRTDAKAILNVQSIELKAMQRQIMKRITANYGVESTPAN